MVKQGDIFWASLNAPMGSEPGHARPYLVVQNDALNRSRIKTAIVCVVTTNLRRAGDPGNVLLVTGEGSLREQSVVNVSQIATINKSQLRDKIGSLSWERIHEILHGINLVLEPRDVPA
ncbi:MAG: type II toxin-antitoxin system PemK/MazF family toxin [Actinomycetota bacterium]|jgi:mRNA interferase MazF|nr:type II toxin-antitoxin system PemK/MazF family toxin [Actinomycetota bacterium]